MELQLSERDTAMLQGQEGEARQIAMRVIVRMANVVGATQLIDVSQAHIDACGYPGHGAITIAETLADKGGQFSVRTTMNAVAESPRTPRLVTAFTRMGAIPTLTCAPYQLSGRPVFGEHLAWGESNAVAFANSVLGARTNRYGDGLEICAALAGRVPLAGYHLEGNRRGTHLIRVPQVQADASFFPVLGYLIGGRVMRGVPVIEGISTTPTEDELKSLSAALASSGAVALFHMVGVTPEAPTSAAVLRSESFVTWDISKDEIMGAFRELTSQQETPVDAVVFGSPHLSAEELIEITRYTFGRRKCKSVEVIVTTSRDALSKAERVGVIDEFKRFGVKCLTDTCPCFLEVPTIPSGAQVILTPSAKYAHYGPGLLGRKVWLASVQDCINAAISGQYTPRTPTWFSCQ